MERKELRKDRVVAGEWCVVVVVVDGVELDEVAEYVVVVGIDGVVESLVVDELGSILGSQCRCCFHKDFWWFDGVAVELEHGVEHGSSLVGLGRKLHLHK